MKATRTCSVEGCTGRYECRGMCHKHRTRMDRSGTTDLPPVPSVADRLAAGLERKPNGCLEWTKGTDVKGYGHFRVDGRLTQTHRVAWELANGPIPDGMWVLHHCDNPPCCDTDPSDAYPEGHLFLGTPADNAADRAAKGRNGDNGERARTHCPQRHEYTEANTYTCKRGMRSCKTCARIRNKTRRRPS